MYVESVEFDGSMKKYVLGCESKHFFLMKNKKTLGVSSYVFCANCGFVGSVADKVKLAEENVHHLLRRLKISTT